MIEGKDITDRIKKGLTPEDAIERLESAVPYDPEDSGTDSNSGSCTEPAISDNATEPSPHISTTSRDHTDAPRWEVIECGFKAPRQISALEYAMNFLRHQLRDAGQPAREIQAAAAAAGVSKSTLRRARTALGIKPRKEGKPGGPGRWVWEIRTRR